MSKKEIKAINMVLKGILFGLAGFIGVLAIMYNLGHLITAGILLVAAFESEFVNEEDYDII